MAEIMETVKKDSKVQNEITQTIEKYNQKYYSIQSKIRQNALIQREVFEKQEILWEILLKIWI